LLSAVGNTTARAIHRSHSKTEGRIMAGTVALKALRSTYYALLTTSIVKMANGNSSLVYDYALGRQKYQPTLVGKW